MKIVKEFLKQEHGAPAVEFAFILPIYVLILACTYDFTSFFSLQHRLSGGAGYVADRVARQPSLTRGDLEAILILTETYVNKNALLPGGGIGKLLLPDHGSIVASHIINQGETNDPSNMVISWQQGYGGTGVGGLTTSTRSGTYTPSTFGAAGDQPAPLPGGLTVTGTESLIVVEMTYDYEPLFPFLSPIGSKTLREVVVVQPRLGGQTTLLGEGTPPTIVSASVPSISGEISDVQNALAQVATEMDELNQEVTDQTAEIEEATVDLEKALEDLKDASDADEKEDAEKDVEKAADDLDKAADKIINQVEKVEKEILIALTATQTAKGAIRVNLSDASESGTESLALTEYEDGLETLTDGFRTLEDHMEVIAAARAAAEAAKERAEDARDEI